MNTFEIYKDEIIPAKKDVAVEAEMRYLLTNIEPVDGHSEQGDLTATVR